MSDELDCTFASIEKIQTKLTELVSVSKGALAIPDLN